MILFKTGLKLVQGDTRMSRIVQDKSSLVLKGLFSKKKLLKSLIVYFDFDFP